MKNQKGEQLKKDFNEAILKLAENGTLSEMSAKYFGGDFSPEK
jgi:ABC-type amino acid transport substrate-binding protein